MEGPTWEDYLFFSCFLGQLRGVQTIDGIRRFLGCGRGGLSSVGDVRQQRSLVVF